MREVDRGRRCPRSDGQKCRGQDDNEAGGSVSVHGPGLQELTERRGGKSGEIGSLLATMPFRMGDVTRLLERWQQGEAGAFEQVAPLIYAELRKLAGHYMRLERGDHTLQPTALINEAYLRLTGARTAAFENRVHFYGAAATAMRRVLVDHARERGAAKRGNRAAVSSTMW